MVTWTAYAILALALIGVAVVAKWIGNGIGALAWKADWWSRQRTFDICGQAILDYEFNRGVNGLSARNFALRIMRQSEVVEW